MRILMVHNQTRHRGGADEAVEQEVELLRSQGHAVACYTRDNHDIDQWSILRKLLLFVEPTWSLKTYRDITEKIQKFKPDILHCHSFFPLISPSLYDAAQHYNVPVVQTLHEYRLLCPLGWFLREDNICEECVEHSLLRSVWYGCYQNSRLKTLPVALMLQVNRWRQTWVKRVNVFTTPSQFARQKLLSSGSLPERIHVHANFLATDPGNGEQERTQALYVGRLSPEKGIVTLLNAWQQLPDIPLKIVGDGPLRDWVDAFVSQHHMRQVEVLGYCPLTTVVEMMQQAYFVVLPSIVYETFGRTIMEAYATGTPVIASRLGAMAELVQAEKTGWLVEPGQPDQLIKTVKAALADPKQLRQLGQQARQVYEQNFTPAIAYERLFNIYQVAQLSKKTGK